MIHTVKIGSENGGFASAGSGTYFHDGGDLDIARHRQLAVVVQLLACAFELIPPRQQLLDIRVLAHDLARTLAIGKKRWVGNIALQSFEAFAFELNKGVQVHKSVVAAVSAARQGAWHKRPYNKLSFFLSSRGFGATVTARKFFNAPGGIHELLFAGEKW